MLILLWGILKINNLFTPYKNNNMVVFNQNNQDNMNNIQNNYQNK